MLRPDKTVHLSKLWTVPLNAWKNKPCCIIGGGSSLKEFNTSCIKDKILTIAVNCAGITIAKWADMLFWSDYRWYEWNMSSVLTFKQLKVTRLRTSNPHFKNRYIGIKDINVLNFNPDLALSHSPDVIGGFDSGSTALNIAYLYGANPIYLLGMDMKTINNEHNFHTLHRLEPTTKDRYKKRFIPVFDRMAVELRNKNITVYTVSTNTALKCFPVLTYKEFMVEANII